MKTHSECEYNVGCTWQLSFSESIVLLEFLLRPDVSELFRRFALTGTEEDAVESILDALSNYRNKLI